MNYGHPQSYEEQTIMYKEKLKEFEMNKFNIEGSLKIPSKNMEGLDRSGGWWNSDMQKRLSLKHSSLKSNIVQKKIIDQKISSQFLLRKLDADIKKIYKINRKARPPIPRFEKSIS